MQAQKRAEIQSKARTRKIIYLRSSHKKSRRSLVASAKHSKYNQTDRGGRKVNFPHLCRSAQNITINAEALQKNIQNRHPLNLRKKEKNACLVANSHQSPQCQLHQIRWSTAINLQGWGSVCRGSQLLLWARQRIMLLQITQTSGWDTFQLSKTVYFPQLASRLQVLTASHVWIFRARSTTQCLLEYAGQHSSMFQQKSETKIEQHQQVWELYQQKARKAKFKKKISQLVSFLSGDQI